MNYSSRIKEKQFTWGGKILTAPFPAHGEVSIIGSIKGGSRLATHLSQTISGDVLSDTHASMILEGTQKNLKQIYKYY